MRLPTLALLLFLLLAAPAAADSLVYAKDGNLWSARPDGSGQVQLTRDGSAVAPYESPSQADDGTIAAIRGTRLVTFDRTGAPRGSFGSVLTGKPGAIGAVGPFDARISPDGRTIGYWLGIMGGWYDYSTHTYYSDPESAVVFQRATDGGFVGDTMFHEEPSWTGDSSKVLLFEGMNGFAKQVSVGAPGANHNEMRGWFHDSDVFADPGGWKPIGAGELSRDGSRLAVLRAHDTVGHFGHQRAARNTIVIYSVNGFDKAPVPLPCWWINDNGYEMTPPQWSPDGRQFAWSSPEGIWVGTIGSTTSCDGWSERLVIPGGRDPDWGPSNHGDAAPDAGPQPGGGMGIAVSGGVRRAALVRHGLAVKVSCSAACEAKAVLKRGKRRVGSARGALLAAGETKLTVRPSRRARRTIKRSRSLALAVTVKPQGAAAQTIRRTVKLR